MKFGLPDQTIATLQAILEHYPAVEEAIIYGSRVKGTHHPGSDIDLALIGRQLSYTDLLQIMREFYDSEIPYCVDVCIFEDVEDGAVRDHIQRRGQILYQRGALRSGVKDSDRCGGDLP